MIGTPFIKSLGASLLTYAICKGIDRASNHLKGTLGNRTITIIKDTIVDNGWIAAFFTAFFTDFTFDSSYVTLAERITETSALFLGICIICKLVRSIAVRTFPQLPSFFAPYSERGIHE